MSCEDCSVTQRRYEELVATIAAMAARRAARRELVRELIKARS